MIHWQRTKRIATFLGSTTLACVAGISASVARLRTRRWMRPFARTWTPT